MYGYIYLTTNLINGKKYIGQHKSDVFDESYRGSGKILTQAIEKEGFDNFSTVIIAKAESKEELNRLEKYYIDLYDAVNSSEFYNLIEGGLGNSQTGLVYITNGSVNKKVMPEELDDYFSKGFFRGGPKQPEELKRRRGEAHKGLKYCHSVEYLEKGHGNRGKKLSSEHREKLSKAKKGKTTSRKGKIQITLNGANPKYILPEELGEYEKLGYEHKGVKWNYK